jgi:hypothetical protein
MSDKILSARVELDRLLEEQSVLDRDYHDKKQMLSSKANYLRRLVNLEDRDRLEFPIGFHFGYNNRRGDPQYTPYWYLVFRDKDGKSLKEYHYNSERYTEKGARTAALEDAWSIYDLCVALLELQSE